MVSTATATARISQITGSGDIVGNVTVQRFAPGGTTGWALFGTPISSALTLNDWDDDMPISCPTCPDGFAAGFYSIYSYNETLPGLYDDASSYIPLNTINDPIVAGKGYWVYFGDGQTNTNSITIDLTGTVRKFGYSIPLNYTNYGSSANDGWNLIHNPYPSSISWNALKGATANIDNAIYVYNADLNAGAGGFASYVNGVSSPAMVSGGIGDVIPMNQGFYVHSTGATNLNCLESNKVAGNQAFLKTNNSSAVNSLLRIALNGPGSSNDETVVYFQSGATDTFDVNFDAFKMRGQDPYAPSIAMQKGNDLFQVNGIAPVSGNFSMPLKTLTGYTGTYTISITDLTSFPEGACITLFDKFTFTTTDLKTSAYVFNLYDTTSVARFDLNITINNLPVVTSINQPICPLPNGGNVITQGTNAGPWNYYWKLNGNTIKTSFNKNKADTLSNLSSGNVELQINTVGSCDNNTSIHVIDQKINPIAQFNSVDTLFLNLCDSVIFTNTSVNSVSDMWYFGNNISSTINSPVIHFNSFGTYTINLVCNSISGCVDSTSKNIVVKIDDVGVNSVKTTATNMIVKSIANNQFILHQQFTTVKTVNFKLYDILGNLITDYGSITSDLISLGVNLDNKIPGIYLVKITYENRQHAIKLIVN